MGFSHIFWISIAILLNSSPKSAEYSSETKLIGVESHDPDDVRFYLYPSSRDFRFHEELKYGDLNSIDNSHYDPDCPIIMLVHGFTQNLMAEFPVIVKNAYLTASYPSKSNIICVDWGKLASPASTLTIPILGDVVSLLSYQEAVENVPVAGRRVQEFLLFLLDNDLLPDEGSSVHIIGHSLGAHVAGIAGMLYYTFTGIKIGRITGTDPAKPLFQGHPIDDRLDETDAAFVDCIHTNAGEVGYQGPLGLVDFFVNGGGPSPQPGCSVADPGCSHNMSWRFYAKSIATDGIRACPCAMVYKNNSTIPIPTVKTCPENEKAVFGEYIHGASSGSYCLQFLLQKSHTAPANKQQRLH